MASTISVSLSVNLTFYVVMSAGNTHATPRRARIDKPPAITALRQQQGLAAGRALTVGREPDRTVHICAYR